MVLGFTFPPLAGARTSGSVSGGCVCLQDHGILLKGYYRFPTGKPVPPGRSSLVCLAGTEIGTDTDATSADHEEEEPKPCTYCHGTLLVVCPVCHGEGVMGRTIECRYCRGKKQLDCPICAVEDEYGWAYDTEKGKDGPEKTIS
ncbi:hypothetical protein NDN08_003806 [Rhodosorus marinus]|uniref:Uncharacterized protein n=1 Tax=Rhodosorus marinus TaxID=101924 RepID=A0AAV8UKJ0_9RHOD|nr:hypothetical protein NDN08_003806 [Rhodosorus marinus]